MSRLSLRNQRQGKQQGAMHRNDEKNIKRNAKEAATNRQAENGRAIRTVAIV